MVTTRRTVAWSPCPGSIVSPEMQGYAWPSNSSHGRESSILQRRFVTTILALLLACLGAACSAPSAPSDVTGPTKPPPSSPSPTGSPSSHTSKGPNPAVLRIAAGFTANEIAFWDVSHGLIVGVARCTGCPVNNQGVIAATNDGGRSWHVVFRGNHTITGVTTFGTMDAWATGDSKVFRTTDGGQTWSVIAHASLVSPSFSSATYGWAGIVPNHSEFVLSIAETTDGGHTWAQIHSPCRRKVSGLPPSMLSARPLFLADLSSASWGAGWATCSGGGAMGAVVEGLYWTGDRGSTWIQRWGAYSRTDGVQILPDGHGASWDWIAGGFETTTDGGAAWHAGGSANPWSIRGAWLVSDATWYALTTVRGPVSLYRSTNAGTTWHVIERR